MMRTTILVTAVLLSMLSASAVYAQRVITVSYDGHPIIEYDIALSSMYTTSAKGRTEAVLKTKEANEKVYRRFAVSKVQPNPTQWSTSFTMCAADWRLPTQRELMLIWVLRNELDKLNNFVDFVDQHYWSATENDFGSSWYVIFSNGYTNVADKKAQYYFRCIRELGP